MRAASMTPEEFRAAGVYLNAGRRRGWKKRLALLLDTPEATVSSWATRSRGNARPVPGAAAVSVRLLAALLRQEAAVRGDLAEAARVLVDRVTALTRRSEPLLPAAAPSAVFRLEPAPPAPERPPLAVSLPALGDRRLRHRATKAPPRLAVGPQPTGATDPLLVAEGAVLEVLPRGRRGGKFENRTR